MNKIIIMEEKKGNKDTKKKTKSVKKSNEFDSFKKEMDNTQRLPKENFRNFAERVGVPSEKVADFKKYLNTNNGRKRE